MLSYVCELPPAEGKRMRQLSDGELNMVGGGLQINPIMQAIGTRGCGKNVLANPVDGFLPGCLNGGSQESGPDDGGGYPDGNPTPYYY
jgi:hypothetical protein